jgi:polysaccharide pyruvyl transferase WcaK-like protein
MRVLIAGASTFGVANLGDDAMFASLVQAIKRNVPVAEVRLLARHPDSAFDDYFGVDSVQNLEHSTNELARGRMFNGLNRGDDVQLLPNVHKEIADADVLVLAGNIFMEVSENSYQRGVSSYAALLTTLAQAARTPIVVFGLNVVDSFSSPVTVQHAKHVLGAASAVFVREEAALHHLSLSGFDVESYKVLGDPAFALQEDQKSHSADLVTLPFSPKSATAPIVTVALRSEYWMESSEPKLSDKALEALAALVALQVKVIAVPNCTYDRGNLFEDDRVVHRLLFEPLREKIFMVEERMGLFETVDFLRSSSLHVTNRRHSAVLAGHARVPVIAVGTSHATHMSGFIQDFGPGIELVNDLAGAFTRAAEQLTAQPLLSRQLRNGGDWIIADRTVRLMDEFAVSLTGVVRNHGGER